MEHVTIKEIEEYLKESDKSHYLFPNPLIVDYPNILGEESSNLTREESQKIFEELSKLASESKISINLLKSRQTFTSKICLPGLLEK